MILCRVDSVDTNCVCLKLLEKRNISSASRSVSQWIGVATVRIGCSRTVAREVLCRKLDADYHDDRDVLALIGHSLDKTV